MFSRRCTSGIACLLCVVLLACAYYWQWSLHVQPCPLCLIQRVLFALLAIVFFMHWCHRTSGLIMQRLYGVSTILIAGIGVITSARQVWLQHLPPSLQPPCGASLDYMLAHFPWHQIIIALFKGTGNCADIVVRLLGLSIAEWSLLFFVVFLIVGCRVVVKT